MQYFKNISTIEQLRKSYNTLAKQYHPDINHSPDAVRIMQDINAEYAAAFKWLQNHDSEHLNCYDKIDPLLEFKFYQNGNTHLKLDKEFAKALNVEVARLLGWIRDKSEIKDEFPDEMADGAEKYFGRSFTISLNNPNIKLLTSN